MIGRNVRISRLLAGALFATATTASMFGLSVAGRAQKQAANNMNAVQVVLPDVPSAVVASPKLRSPEDGIIAGAKVQRDTVDGRIRRVRGAIPIANGATPLQAATTFLRSNAKTLNLSANLNELSYQYTKPSLTASHVVFYQQQSGLRVHGGYLSVHISKKGQIVLVNNDLLPITGTTNNAVAIANTAPDKAIAAAVAAVKSVSGPRKAPVATPEVYVSNGKSQAVWKINFGTRYPPAEWEIFVEPISNKLVAARNQAKYVDGTGFVFNPNPITVTGLTNFVDGNDADTAALTAARTQVTLRGLSGNQFLDGQFASTAGKGTGVRAQSATNTFDYTRGNTDFKFEEVCVYYHCDTTERYIQSLGFTNINNRVMFADPSDGDYFNAFYSPQTKDISFGTAGVDFAEDADVILHEYGHSIQDDQVPDWGLSEEGGAMGEGFGDYWSATTFAGVGPKSPQWDSYLAEWIGTQLGAGDPPHLRDLLTTKHYPEDQDFEVHDDGEMWSASLWQIWHIVGKTRADTMVLEAHFRLTPFASFEDGALALLAVNEDLYSGADQAAIRQVLLDRGFIQVPPTLNTLAINAGAATTNSRWVTLDNTITGNASEFLASEDPNFTGATWDFWWDSPFFQLSSGDGVKTVYMKVRNSSGESNVLVDTIVLAEIPEIEDFSINGGAATTLNPVVTLNNTWSITPAQYMASEDQNFAGATWKPYSAAPSFTLSNGFSEKTVYLKVRNANGESEVAVDTIRVTNEPGVTYMRINNDVSDLTLSRVVTLNNAVSNNPTEYMASENESFAGAAWKPYSGAPSFTLSPDDGWKIVYFKVRNQFGQSNVEYDFIELQELPSVQGFSINNNAITTSTRNVVLNNFCIKSPTEYIASENPNFTGATWQPYTTAPAFQLSAGDGTKTVYFKVRKAVGESASKPDAIQLLLVPVVTSYNINSGAVSTKTRAVTLNNTVTGTATHYIASEYSSFVNATWQTYSTAPTFTLSAGNGTKTVYFKVKGPAGESTLSIDTIVLTGLPEVVSMGINQNRPSTTDRNVTLDNVTNGIPTQYKASESPTFAGASWLTYGQRPSFVLSAGNGIKTVYFKTQNAAGESNVVSDTILLGIQPVVTSFAINNGAATTTSQVVTLNNSCVGSPTAYQASLTSDFTGLPWTVYSAAPSFTLPATNGVKTVYFRIMNSTGISEVVSDTITLAMKPVISTFAINNGAPGTASGTVTLNNTATGGPTEYLASESSTFVGATWKAYGAAPSFTLSANAGLKTVYLKLRNANGESGVRTDTIQRL